MSEPCDAAPIELSSARQDHAAPSEVSNAPKASGVLKPYLLTLCILTSTLLAFQFFRLFSLVAYRAEFTDLPAKVIFSSVLRGLRFDLSSTFLFLGLPIWMLLLPLRQAGRTRFRNATAWAAFGVWTVMTWIMAIDVGYYTDVSRHIGTEIAAAENDWIFIWSSIIFDFWWAILLMGGLSAAAGFGWRAAIRKLCVFPSPTVSAWIVFALLPVVAVIAIRGGFQRRPITTISASKNASHRQAYLSLNGVFSLTHSLRPSSEIPVNFYPFDDALASVKPWIKSERETVTDPEYPLMRIRKPAPRSGRQPNVIIILLEGVRDDSVDVLRRDNNLPPIGATPELDAFSESARVYTRFYANGQRSINGITAMLCGLPTLPGVPYLGRGMEQNRIAYIPSIFRSAGYETIFIQGSVRDSFHVDSIAELSGFSEYYSAEDITQSKAHADHDDPYGAWDYDMLMKMHERCVAHHRSGKPFFGFAFTLSTHRPHHVPLPRWEKFTAADSPHWKYLNTIYYLDWSLGEFFRLAQTEGYLDNSIVVIVSDHYIGNIETNPSDLTLLHRIPCIIRGPGIDAGLDPVIASQADIMPTLMDLCGVPGPHTGTGVSLVEPGVMNRALCIQGDTKLWIEPDGWVAAVNQQLSEKSPDNPKADEMLNTLLSWQQVVITLHRRNRLCAPTVD
ncbi:MAG: LTA synthase family protein [Planctomycetota bacterium]